MTSKNKKGVISLGELPGLAMTLVFTAAVLVGGFLVLVGLGDAGETDGNASTTEAGTAAANNMTLAMENIVGYAPTWGTIIGVSILIGIVVGGFAFARNKGFI